MFNWFRRKATNQPDSSPTTPETQPEVTITDETAESETPGVAQADYLAYAKAAYKNIQQRKQEVPQQPTESETEKSEVEAVPEKETATIDTTEDRETVAEVETTKKREIAKIETPTTDTAEAIENTPPWMLKSQGLEKLKETAIEETTDETPVTLDEDFVWSAKVLADSGRSVDDVSEEEINWLTKLRQGLGKTRRSLINQLKSIVGQGPLNEDAVMEIEGLLLQADVGIEATDYIIETLQEKLKQEALPPEQAIAYLKNILQQILDKPLEDLEDKAFVPEEGKFNIWLLTGVNGAGKTTTIGKLANLGQKSGYKCMIAAADTFRAAAVQQVKVWGERANTPVVANEGKNTDPAAVVYDAIAAAQSRNTDLLLVDTAGRLQNKQNLMAELSKIRRIIDKKAPNAKVESLLVLDATLGQNGLRQAQVFSEAAKLSGVVLTKLDGTAKGGVALAVTQQLNLPIRFIGAGEGIEDLRPFSSYEFVEALING
ncbi:MAG: signal recognition particle-docking protein FtsY [Pleurocapsa sp.]